MDSSFRGYQQFATEQGHKTVFVRYGYIQWILMLWLETCVLKGKERHQRPTFKRPGALVHTRIRISLTAPRKVNDKSRQTYRSTQLFSLVKSYSTISQDFDHHHR
jgi:hypothetical protein